MDNTTFLVVEDSPTMRQLISFSLNRFKNSRIIEAVDGVDGGLRAAHQVADRRVHELVLLHPTLALELLADHANLEVPGAARADLDLRFGQRVRDYLMQLLDDVDGLGTRVEYLQGHSDVPIVGCVRILDLEAAPARCLDRVDRGAVGAGGAQRIEQQRHAVILDLDVAGGPGSHRQ